MNNRRKLVVAFGASVFAAPFASSAQQQGKVWRIGVLWERAQSDPNYVRRIDAFRAGMRELGYSEDRHYIFLPRFAQNDFARLPALAAELLELKCDVILAAGTPAAIAARDGAHGIPILIMTAGNPVGTGLAATLSRPGGRVTGLSQDVGSDLYTKRLDLLRQLLPDMRRVGFLFNPDNAGDVLTLGQFESDCKKLGFQSIRAPARKREEIATAFNILRREKAQGLIVGPVLWPENVIEQAAKLRLPAIYGTAYPVELGGLISYTADQIDLYRRAAAYADKIFKGAKPGDLPIEQPIKFETIINLKTAKALGIKMPDVIMLRADKVIE